MTNKAATMQKKKCYFDNWICHQNCNCWHDFRGWYYNSPLWQLVIYSANHNLLLLN